MRLAPDEFVPIHCKPDPIYDAKRLQVLNVFADAEGRRRRRKLWRHSTGRKYQSHQPKDIDSRGILCNTAACIKWRKGLFGVGSLYRACLTLMAP
jgi:hypothetical protein